MIIQTAWQNPGVHARVRFQVVVMISRYGIKGDAGERGKPVDGGDQTNIYTGTVQSGEQIVGAMLKEQASIPSTLIVNQGQHIQVLMARDLDFSDVYGLRAVQ